MMGCASLHKNTYLSSYQTRTYVWNFGACTIVQYRAEWCVTIMFSRVAEHQLLFPDIVLNFDQRCETAVVVS
jgi:hypothetical protein